MQVIQIMTRTPKILLTIIKSKTTIRTAAEFIKSTTASRREGGHQIQRRGTLNLSLYPSGRSLWQLDGNMEFSGVLTNDKIDSFL